MKDGVRAHGPMKGSDKRSVVKNVDLMDLLGRTNTTNQ